MINVINYKLLALEAQNKIKILFACESGSRAWGFHSPDSDYDVRFIYAHSKDYYLSIDDNRDVIEVPANDILDINGWDIRKALRLFRGSNAPLYEWLQSPIVYKSDQLFIENIRPMMPVYFSLRSSVHHYSSMAKKTFLNDLQGEEIRLKKYFYALRPLLAALWILEKKSIPPMEFSKLRVLIQDEAVDRAIEDLLKTKKVSDEKTVMKPSIFLNSYIDRGIAHCDANSNTFSKKQTDTAPLDQLFRQLINEF
jgi:predicted nucleotidyltransferase